MQSRQEEFQQIQDTLKEKLKSFESGKETQTKLQELIEDLNAEVSLLQTQKNEKDAKLKNQIRKNEELLGELQELSEAVNALKNNQEFTMTS